MYIYATLKLLEIYLSEKLLSHYIKIIWSTIQLLCKEPMSAFTLCIAKHSYLYQVVPWFDQYPRWFSGKESTCQCGRPRRCWFSLWVRKILWRRKWLPPQIFVPAKLHGQRGLVGYNSCGHKESDMTEYTLTTIVSTVVDGMK